VVNVAEGRSEQHEQYREWEESRMEYERLAVACVRTREVVPVLVLTARDWQFLKACGVKVW
jgi:hypothetical protein